MSCVLTWGEAAREQRKSCGEWGYATLSCMGYFNARQAGLEGEIEKCDSDSVLAGQIDPGIGDRYAATSHRPVFGSL